MNTIRTILLICSIAALGACAVEQTESSVEHVELSPDDVAEDSTVCTCDTQECIEEWIRDNMGCGICVAFACEPPKHACVLCPEQLPYRSVSTQGEMLR